ncbi:MAG: hypothetical protein OXC99_09850 [Chloroflexi bacterium]|nr:hypothetical protein [Chloroflexota bacterium]
MTTTDGLAAQAQEGRKTLETAILGLLEAHPEGLKNADIAKSLGLRSSFKGGHRNHLTHSLLGGLLARGLAAQDKTTLLYTAVATTSDALTAIAEEGRRTLEAAILRLLEAHPEGLKNVEVTSMLGLRSSFRGGHRNYLTHSLLGGLLTKGLVEQDEATLRYTKV